MPIDTTQPVIYNKDCLVDVVSRAVFDALSAYLPRDADLDNCIQNTSLSMKEGKDMSRIKKHIKVGGEYRWITADSEQEYAEKVAMAFMQSGLLSSRTLKPSTSHPFGEYAQNWLDVFEKPQVATVTGVTYQRYLNKYLKTAFADKDVETITTNDIQILFNSLKSKSIETVNKVKNLLNMILRHAVDEKIIDSNPMDSGSLNITGGAGTKTPAYSVEDMKYFVSHIDMIESPRDRAWFALMLFHPLRSEECLGLKHKNVKNTKNGITMQIAATVTHPTRNEPVYAEKTKTDKSRRELQISPTAVQYIPDGDPESFIVYNGDDPAQPMSYTSLRRMCARIARQIGYAGAITPRRFRTTVASDLYAATKDIKLVQNALGHSRYSQVAFDHYIECRQDASSAGSIIDTIYT